MNPVKDTLYFLPLLVSYEAAGLLWMSGENCDFVHNYMCRCVRTVRGICLSCVRVRVYTHWCTLVGPLCVSCYGLHKY